jgi:hypothetical protein
MTTGLAVRQTRQRAISAAWVADKIIMPLAISTWATEVGHRPAFQENAQRNRNELGETTVNKT